MTLEEVRNWAIILVCCLSCIWLWQDINKKKGVSNIATMDERIYFMDYDKNTLHMIYGTKYGIYDFNTLKVVKFHFEGNNTDIQGKAEYYNKYLLSK